VAGSSITGLYELFDQLCRAPDDASVLLVPILQRIQTMAQSIAQRRAERNLPAQHLEAVEQMLATVFADVDRRESAAAPTIDQFASRARALCAELLIMIAPPATHPEPQRLDELAREARALLRNVPS
jgi:hypothetical protein